MEALTLLLWVCEIEAGARPDVVYVDAVYTHLVPGHTLREAPLWWLPCYCLGVPCVVWILGYLLSGNYHL